MLRGQGSWEGRAPWTRELDHEARTKGECSLQVGHESWVGGGIPGDKSSLWGRTGL